VHSSKLQRKPSGSPPVRTSDLIQPAGRNRAILLFRCRRRNIGSTLLEECNHWLGCSSLSENACRRQTRPKLRRARRVGRFASRSCLACILPRCARWFSRISENRDLAEVAISLLTAEHRVDGMNTSASDLRTTAVARIRENRNRGNLLFVKMTHYLCTRVVSLHAQSENIVLAILRKQRSLEERYLPSWSFGIHIAIH
jgi:hypothetical protein